MSVTACSFWCHKLQAVCLVFLSDLESVNAALAVRSGCWGQCCSRLALATRGSAVFLDPVDLQNEQLWLHRWQIIERVEKSKECLPAHNSLLKNAHHALSLPAKAPGRKRVFPACLPFMLGNISSTEHVF